MFISFEYFYPQGSWISGKNIWEFTHKDFLAIIRVGSEASKGLKGFFLCFFLKPLNSFYHFPPAPPPEVEPPPKLPPEEPLLLPYPPLLPEEELRVRLAIV